MDMLMSMFCSTNNHCQSDLRVELLDILRDLLSAAEPKEIDRALRRCELLRRASRE